ncbi:NAD(P)/FAD-dependent oxidoreductase [Aquihabitans sp. G128]|uniref:phytoene desaturase family protein n=1 Tax=Aquihabitans sp. G128 TaxID=2849779 RepID=UPI001C21C228|nr:NAD(P)/FAD-dependent oxidoreductase [Aquihabitans sp. G128]QXC59619.1 NAD(P)/FAD-dependent oxidoreductase [Aquihabitans sp. G128]
MVDAVVVGSGPNGLAAAVALAREGHSVTVLEAAPTIGGGTRTEELTVPGVLHDVCSAVHPFGLASPFFASLPLEEHGLTWCHPEVDLAHPLDDGSAGVMLQDIDATAAGLGDDGAMWKRTFGRLASGFDEIGEDLLRPILHVPKHPLRLVGFGLNALQPATVLAQRWKTDQARALFAGVAAHVIHPLAKPVTASVGLMLIASGHHVGWPVAQGGSRSITDALARLLRELGGTIETGTRVDRLADLPDHRVALFDTSPRSLAAIAGDALPPRTAKAYARFRYGPGSFKVDLAIEGPVPWTNEAARRSGTVHLGGTIEEVAAAEKAVALGHMPERPFVLVAQQHLADPSRSNGNVHPLWAYCHVPKGYTGDATEAILRQMERFAPGVRDQVVGMHVAGPVEVERVNANYVGGDIAAGANTALQVVFRPRVALDPYATGIPGTFLCSASTPPGGGVHGMCGAGAAASALRYLRR